MHVFKYFDQPRTSPTSAWSNEGAPCELCGRTGPGYGGPFYGEDAAIDRVCEECLATGQLARRGLRGANSGDAERLRAQLSALSPAEREALVQARTTELEACTPHLVTWQDLSWPAHCGDYCRYVAEVGRKELSALAPDGNGAAFFLAHLHERDRELALEFSSLPPQASTRETGAYDIGVYLFRCLGCGTAVIHWDAS